MMSLLHRSSIRLATVYTKRSVALFVAACALAACAGDKAPTGPGAAARSVSLSVMTTAPASTSGLTGAADRMTIPGAAASVVTTSGHDTLVITTAQVVLSRLELASGMGTDCEGEDEEEASTGCHDIARSFVLIDLPTDTAVHTLFETPIPPGTYSSLEARLRVPHADSDTSAVAFLAAHPEFAGANVRVVGTFDDTPFVYTGAVNSRLEMDFDPPITVDSTGRNITVNVNLGSWFRNAMTGTLIDPNTANPGGVNAALVAANIRRSFRAFRDDHHDGHDDGGGDHQQGGSGDGGGHE